MDSETATRLGVSTGSRTLALLSALGTGVGALLFVGAVLASQCLAYPGYVSETGVPGQPYAVVYRLGIFGFAAGLVLLAAALRQSAALPALILLTSGLLAGVSGSVPCSEGCPLPPFERPTPGDLVHGGASVAGVGLCALAILLLAVGHSTQSGLRRLSRIALIPIIAVGLLNAYGIAFVGRGPFIGVVERMLLVLIVGWCLAAATSRSAERTWSVPGSPTPSTGRGSYGP